jgi:Flp pilus assembly protein TadG
MRSVQSSSNSRRPRRGIIVILAAVGLLVLLAITILSVDTAYIQLTRTELRVATDAAAKAAAEALMRTQDTAQAVAAAKSMASLNKVAGKPLQIATSDVVFGNTTQSRTGEWAFQGNVAPYNSVQVMSSLQDSNANGSVNLFFAGMIGKGKFQPTEKAVATVYRQDVLLCIDRSHSMCFDLSGVNWVYPSGRPWTTELKNPPHALKSRWASLRRAVDDYLGIVDDIQPPPRVGLVTWASEITTSTTEYAYTGKTSKKTLRDAALSSDYTTLRNAIATKSVNVMLGGTEMSAGIDEAIAVLKSSDRPLSKKIIVLMTDGQWNLGRSPVLCAQEARDANIVIHTISFLPGAVQNDLVTVAETTGGRHYHAENEAELRDAFSELAKSLPVILTK